MCLNVTTLEAVVKGNSIHDGFRAVTIHGTYGTSENALGVEVSKIDSWHFRQLKRFRNSNIIYLFRFNKVY